MDAVSAIADAVLYEGYLLWPYRRSALKNRRRWTFGAVYPRGRCPGAGDRWLVRTECLVQTGLLQTGRGAGPATGPGTGRPADARTGPVTVTAEARFLHAVRRDVLRVLPDGRHEHVDELTVAGRRYLSWEEATERRAGTGRLDLAALCRASAERPVEVPAGHDTEWLEEPGAGRAGAVVRSWHALRGSLVVRARRACEGVHVLTAELRNTSPDGPGHGEDAVSAFDARAFTSAHLVLRVRGGRFVSLTDPPPSLHAPARACDNAGLWPVLAGPDDGEGADGTDRTDRADDTVLAAPIVLPDHPKIAPESPGDLFDATEIDQLLTLSVLGLTDEERREMRDTDPRARAILERIEAMTPDELMRLHGTIRDLRPLGRE